MGKKSSPPPPPDYAALAEKTASSNAEAIKTQTSANRPDQTDVYGNTSKWAQDPTTGQWSQNQQLGQRGQEVLGYQDTLRKGLMGTPLTADGLPQANLDTIRGHAGNLSGAGLFNMDPTGNSKDIQDATYKLLTPQRDMAREGEIQRLKNQGLTEDSPAFQRAMFRLDQGDTDAQLKSLLAGTTEYGNQFQRGINENQQNFDQTKTENQQNFNQTSEAEQFAHVLRTGGMAERGVMREVPLNELERFSKLSGTQFGNFLGAGSAGGTDYLGAGSQQYNAEVANNNASNASAAGTTNGLLSLASSAAMVY